MGDWLLKKPTRLLWTGIVLEATVAAALISMGQVPFGIFGAMILLIGALVILKRREP